MTYSDPREWSAAKRSFHLAELGLHLIETPDGREVSLYQGVYIDWTTTLDTRITFVIDEIHAQGFNTLMRAWAHKGGCGFLWEGGAPFEYAPDSSIAVHHERQVIDWWVIERYDATHDAVIVFQDRVSELRSLAYSEYLQSSHWQTLRAQALVYHGDTCSLCGKKPVDVHHRTYVNLGNERMQDLTVLCRKCHSKFHAEAA